MPFSETAHCLNRDCLQLWLCLSAPSRNMHNSAARGAEGSESQGGGHKTWRRVDAKEEGTRFRRSVRNMQHVVESILDSHLVAFGSIIHSLVYTFLCTRGTCCVFSRFEKCLDFE